MTGQTISHFRVLDKLGGGGMGVVYLGEDTRLKRKVALKFLPPHLSTDAEARQRFEQEAEAASALNHPNVCTIYEIGDAEDGQTFIAMALYEGETLKAKLASGGVVSSTDCRGTAALRQRAQAWNGYSKIYTPGRMRSLQTLGGSPLSPFLGISPVHSPS